jgi:hypothetical protein
MENLPQALQYLGLIQENAELRKTYDYLFSGREIRPDDLVSDAVARARITNASLAKDPKYKSLLKEIPETQSVMHYAILKLLHFQD